MPEPTTILLFMAAALALNLTPGPDMLYALTRSIGQGWRGGVAAATGGLAGSLGHTVFAVVGLSALLVTSATAFTVVKFVGAGYLVYLGIRAMAGGKGSLRGRLAAREAAPLRKVAVEAFWIHTLNPKVAVFFVAFLPQFVSAGSGSAVVELAVLGIVFTVQAWVVLCLLSVFAGRIAGVIRGRGWLATLLDRVTGVVYLSFGARLAAASAR